MLLFLFWELWKQIWSILDRPRKTEMKHANIYVLFITLLLNVPIFVCFIISLADLKYLATQDLY